MSYPTIVLITDFGDGNGSGAMTGVCKRVDANLKVYDLTNDISRFDVRAASRTLSNQLSSWPQGSVFVCAVDPASGTNERVLACLTKDGYLLVGPDNGCLSDSIAEHGAQEVRDLSALNASYLSNEPASVYHGRNLAYCGACIAAEKPAFFGAGNVCTLADIKTAF
jgi:S-adenosylmethionine hydrolase